MHERPALTTSCAVNAGREPSERGRPALTRGIVARPMAIASAPAAAPSATSRRSRRAALRHLPAAATVAGVAVLLAIVYAPLLNYDARYALVWARDLASGV